MRLTDETPIYSTLRRRVSSLRHSPRFLYRPSSSDRDCLSFAPRCRAAEDSGLRDSCPPPSPRTFSRVASRRRRADHRPCGRPPTARDSRAPRPIFVWLAASPAGAVGPVLRVGSEQSGRRARPVKAMLPDRCRRRAQVARARDRGQSMRQAGRPAAAAGERRVSEWSARARTPCSGVGSPGEATALLQRATGVRDRITAAVLSWPCRPLTT